MGRVFRNKRKPEWPCILVTVGYPNGFEVQDLATGKKRVILKKTLYENWVEVPPTHPEKA